MKDAASAERLLWVGAAAVAGTVVGMLVAAWLTVVVAEGVSPCSVVTDSPHVLSMDCLAILSSRLL